MDGERVMDREVTPTQGATEEKDGTQQPTSTPSMTLPATGGGGASDGVADWFLGAIAGTLALSGASFLLFRYVR